MRSLEETEQEEIVQKQKYAEEIAENLRLSTCFVEYLNGRKFIETLFACDEDGLKLLSIGEDVKDIVEE